MARQYCRAKSSHGSLDVPILTPSGELYKPEGLKLIFQGVEYSVPSNHERGAVAYLLKNVSGYFESGQMAALIGPSGSGKTTLLDVLAGRKTQGVIKGSILYGGLKPTKAFLRKCAGYVEQFDTLLDKLTVYEMLLYTAELKRPVEESFEAKRTHVEILIEKMALEKVKNMKIGQQGGIKKRVNIGISLITKPKVLFLDEPTTGLDSYTANETMNVVKKMAKEGTTICSTIHSPTPFTFSLFDRVMFLLGGEVVFFGERHVAAGFLSKFAEDSISTFDNEADWLTCIIVKADRQQKGPIIAEAYENSPYKKNTIQSIGESLQDEDVVLLDFLDDVDFAEDTATPFWFSYRTSRNLASPMFWVPRLADKFTFLLLFVLTYNGMGNDYEDNRWQNVASILFLLALFPSFGAAVYAPNIFLERPLLYRELDDGMYKTGAFVLMKVAEESIVGVISSFITTTMAWYAISLQGDFTYLFLIYFGHLMNGITTAYACAAIGADVNMSNALLTTYTSILCFFSGMLILPSRMPAYWKWLYYIDYARYGFEVLMLNHFKSNEKAIADGAILVPPSSTQLPYANSVDSTEQYLLPSGLSYPSEISRAGLHDLSQIAVPGLRHGNRTELIGPELGDMAKLASAVGLEGTSQVTSVLDYYELDDVDIKKRTMIVYFFALAHFVVAYLCTRFIRHQKR